MTVPAGKRIHRKSNQPRRLQYMIENSEKRHSDQLPHCSSRETFAESGVAQNGLNRNAIIYISLAFVA
ncbi:hypothetical protein E2C01_056353 [Portunus trituberculatus]|uniref:Uncharacterized protein n=1 Tax=Portunus trituberculatus TaxID=210409 RepID=A0A5B7GQD8_PORTR|nr:hypothetical protein [Portunus trituberculatus]